MNQRKVVPLALLGKESQFPFTGIFAARAQVAAGSLVAVGRIHDADVKKDFRQVVEFSKGLEHICMQNSKKGIKGLLRAIWDWYHTVKLHSQIVCLCVEVMTPKGELWISTLGASGLWAKHKDTWYPLFGERDSTLHNPSAPYPFGLQISPIPERILVVPQPMQRNFPSANMLAKRVYEVSNVD